MTDVHILYLDGTEETFSLPVGVTMVRTPDLLRLGTVEIERRAVRRTTTSAGTSPPPGED